MKEIEDKRDQRLRVARAWRTHLNEISQAEFEIKEYQAHCTFQVSIVLYLCFHWLLTEMHRFIILITNSI